MARTNELLRGLNTVVLVIGTLLVADACLAHEVRPAYLQITEQAADSDGQLQILWKQPVVADGRLAIDPVFPAGCELKETAAPAVVGGALIRQWRSVCSLDSGVIRIAGLETTIIDVLVRIERADGGSSTHLLRPEDPVLDLAERQGAFSGYLTSGIEHLLFGLDHVLFVLGVVLIVHGGAALFKAVTAFTIAHSITLFLAVTQLVRLNQSAVEVMIAVSILFLAQELAKPSARRSRLVRSRPWIMTFVFGLLHGLGFADALQQVGLPKNALWHSLLMFNIGIELGQLLLIAVFVTLAWLFRAVLSAPVLLRMVTLGMGSAAAYWLIDRSIGLLA